MVAVKKAPKSDTTTTTSVVAPSGPMALAISDRAGLAGILATLASVADAKSTMPMLANTLVRVGRDGTVLAATDLTVWATYRAPAWIGGTGGRCIPAKKLADMVRRMPRHEITLRGTEHGIVLASGKVETSLLGVPDRDFPRVPEPSDGVEWMGVSVASLRSVIKPTISAVCTDETRFHLCALYLEAGEGILRAVSTDGHRLHKAQTPSAWRLDGGIIVPSKAVKLLAKHLADGYCEIARDKFMLYVRQGGWTFAIKLIDAQYPPHDQVIPKDRDAFITVARETFIEALERAKIHATDTRGVHLKAEGNDLKVISENPDLGTTIETFPCEFTGKPFEIGANVKYLIESLKVVDDDRVTFACQGELDPILVRGTEDMGTRALGDSALVCVVMPMRIN